MAQRKDSKLDSKNIAIVGLGRVGLPLALVFANLGYKVFGIDIDEEKIALIKKGKMPFMEEGGEALLKKVLGKTFFPETQYEPGAHTFFIILTLGTPVDENMNPSYSQIDQALQSLKPFLKSEQTLILRSTVSPGTTEYVRQFIDNLPRLKVSENFFLAYAPERIAEGRALEEIRSIPQIVGGIDGKSTDRAANLFSSIGVEVIKTDAVSAELAKLFTNMYRYINFAVANEFMFIAGNYRRDVYEIVNLVNHNYKRGGLAVPGLTAGPCLFKDGFFLISDVPFADLIATSWKINESVPIFLVKKVRERIKLAGKKAAVLGLAFKAEIDDPRESLAFKVKKALERERAKVFLHDPYVPGYQNNLNETLKDADLIFLATNHKYYEKLDIAKVRRLVSKNCVICDVWNIFKTNRIIFTVRQLHDLLAKSEGIGPVFEGKWRDI